MIEAWADLHGVALIEGETDAQLKGRIIKRFIKPNLVINKAINLPEDESIFATDRWQAPFKYPQALEMSHKERLDFLCGAWVTDPAEDRLLDEIKNSHHKLYGEVLTYREAYAKLEKMRIGIERHMATGKK
tara:strand:- start:27726 stop:28118 length:393 start_codon:yes stop_codon:yes gene_type:complete